MKKTMIIKKGTEFIDENMVMFKITEKYYDNYRCERYSFNFDTEEFSLESDDVLLTAAEVAHLAEAKKVVWEEEAEE